MEVALKNYCRLFITVLLLSYSQCLLSCDRESDSSDDREPFVRVQQDGLQQPKKTWLERCKEYLKKLFEKRDNSDG